MEPTKIEPGQSLVFTPKNARQELQFRDGNIQNNVLSAFSDPGDLNCFYANMWGPAANTGKSLQYKFKRYWENGYHIGYEESTSARLRIASKTAPYIEVISAGSQEDPDFPIVHTMDIHNWFRGNEGRWHDINRPWLPLEKISTSNSIPPDNRTKLGIRLKSFAETPENLANMPKALWDFPIFETSNMRAPFYRRTPWDWLEGVPTVLHEFNYGPLTSDNQEQPGYLDPFMRPRFLGDVAETSPFLNTSTMSGDLRYVLFDIPPANLEVFSIGQLRQVPLTHEFSAPTFIIGESVVPTTSPREHSAYPTSVYSGRWWQGLHQDRVRNYATWWEPSYDPSVNYAAFDYRYETNLALWDKYFFSTLPKSAKLSDYTTPGSLPNSNMSIANPSGKDLTQDSANKPDTVAQYLRLNNHHSVNSTNLVAWKALLSMNMGLNVNGQSTDSNSAPFPGTSRPLADGNSSTTSSVEESWTGYRQLSSDEIDLLARNIVEQVKLRAPFISLSDFVNRRLRSLEMPSTSSPDVSTQSNNDLMSYAGPIEIAIQQSAINAGFRDHALKASNEYSTSSYGGTGFDTANVSNERFANAPSHLTQGKILETIGAQLTPRSDTFKIRAYGESRDQSGKLLATAWCEAVVQRSAEYLDNHSDNATVGYKDLSSDINKLFGRKYQILSFRWLSAEELSTN